MGGKRDDDRESVSGEGDSYCRSVAVRKGGRGQNRDIPSSSKPVVGEEGSSSSPYPISQSEEESKPSSPSSSSFVKWRRMVLNESGRAEASDASSACPCWRGSTVGTKREAAVNSPLENIPLVQGGQGEDCRHLREH